jgi:hypothetical protein
VDKTAPQNQIFLGTLRKCSENPGVDCRVSVRVGCHRKEKIQAPAIPLRNSTDSEHLYFRKNARPATVSAKPITIFQRTKS